MRGTAVAVGLLLVACAPLDAPDATVQRTEQAPAEPAPTERKETAETEQFEWSHTGEQSTEPFTLAGGRYVAMWELDSDCFYSLALKSPEGPGRVDVGGGDEPGRYRDNLYDIEPGEYYLNVITGPPPNCSWRLTLRSK